MQVSRFGSLQIFVDRPGTPGRPEDPAVSFSPSAALVHHRDGNDVVLFSPPEQGLTTCTGNPGKEKPDSPEGYHSHQNAEFLKPSPTVPIGRLRAKKTDGETLLDRIVLNNTEAAQTFAHLLPALKAAFAGQQGSEAPPGTTLFESKPHLRIEA